MRFTWTKPKRRVHELVVRQRPVGNATHAVAEAAGAASRKVLAANRDYGHSRIRVDRGDLSDAFVVLDDTAGDLGAHGIEFGFKRNGRFYFGPAPLRKGAASL